VTTTAGRPVPESPYKGLVPYFEEDAPFFFGRQDEQEIIAANLQAYRLTLLYGPSGVGKSSVLRAGVAHHLREAARSTVGVPEYVIVVFSAWRDDPVAGLVEAIHSALAASIATAAEAKPDDLLSDTLAKWTADHDTELLVILDQFEEYFLYHPESSDERSFAHQFARAVNRRDLRVNFLVSIRDDALSKLDRFKGRIATLFDNYLRIDHLGREAAAEAIERPIEEYNRRSSDSKPVTIEPALTRAVLDQLGTGRVTLGARADAGVLNQKVGAGERIETPLLQLVMTRLWKEERAAASNVLRLETLTRLGGAERIVRTHLDAAMSSLTAVDRLMAARAFRYLVTPSGTKIAHTLVDLADYAGIPPEQLAALAEKLSSGEVRILRPVSTSPGSAAVARYEIFHDVLAAAIADWRRRTEVEHTRRVDTLLRPLHRCAWTLGTVCLAATATIAVAFLTAIGHDPDSSDWSLSPFLIGGAIVLGLLLLAGTGVWAIRRATTILMALRAGFTWPALADVVADRQGTLGDLASGRGTYGTIASEGRARIRGRKRHQVILWLMAAVAPAAGIVAVVALGSRGLIRLSDTPAVVIGPSLLFLTGIGALWLMNALTLRKASRGAPPGSEARHDRHSARDPLDGVVAAEPFAAPVRRARYVFAVWVLGVSLLCLATALASLPVAFTVIAAPILTGEFHIRDLKIRQAEMRLPPDPTQTPLAAGRAYYSLVEAGRTASAKSYEHAVPRVISAPSWTVTEDNPFDERLPEVFKTLIERAAKGLDERQRRFVERFAAFDGFAESAQVARAAEIDYLGARLRPGHRFPVSLAAEVSMTGGLTRSYCYIAKAALELADNRRPEAETTLKEMISFALVVISESHSLLEVLLSDQMLTYGLKGLEQLYRATGETERATEIQRQREAGTTVPSTSDTYFLRQNLVSQKALRETLERVAKNPERPRGERWDALALAGLLPCTNAMEVLFGPSELVESIFESSRAALVRFPSEQELFDNTRSSVPLLGQLMKESAEYEGGVAAHVGRWSGTVFGNDRIKFCPGIAAILRESAW
jgi:hypothetical protein